MLLSLYIRDFALIDELEIPFNRGLNIITGQTGAGKSILIGALNMVLGGRADTEVIRTGSQKAIAEATFMVPDNPVLKTLLAEHEVEWTDRLLLRREIKPSGSRAFINDSPVAVTVLREVGEWLVDLHGQHDHQQLLREDHHRAFLDLFSDVAAPLGSYRTAYNEMASLMQQREKLLSERRTFAEKLELYKVHAKEIDALKIKPGEEDELRAEMKLLDAGEDLARITAEILDAGQEADDNVLSLLKRIADGLGRLQEFEAEFSSYAEEVKAASISISEMLHSVNRFKNGLTFNPRRLDAIRERLTDLRNAQRRFHRTPEELLAYRQEIADFMDAGDSYEDRLEQLEKALESARAALSAAAELLYQARRARGARLSDAVCAVLAEVGIPNAVFSVQLDREADRNGWITAPDGTVVKAGPDGAETVRFLISTNKGEAPKPLAKIASGGEISRVMLALKHTMAREQALPVMVFDEIDTGISGAVSEKVGRVMRQLSRHCQIITITHQPQIACQGDQHYRVEKLERNDRTISNIRLLPETEQIEELARLSSGEVVTAAALESAREMMARVRQV
jgi:DNA repair protein RecN (Recombination protein N)